MNLLVPFSLSRLQQGITAKNNMQANPEPIWVVGHENPSCFLFEPKVSNKGALCFHLQSAFVNVLKNVGEILCRLEDNDSTV